MQHISGENNIYVQHDPQNVPEIYLRNYIQYCSSGIIVLLRCWEFGSESPGEAYRDWPDKSNRTLQRCAVHRCRPIPSHRQPRGLSVRRLLNTVRKGAVR